MRRLTDYQQCALDIVNQRGEVTIQEVAEEAGMAYPTAVAALARLHWLDAVIKEPLGDGTRKIIYRKLVLENHDSSDPLEQAFAAPSAKVKR